MKANYSKLAVFQILILATLSQHSTADLTTFNEPCLGVVGQFSDNRDGLLCQTPSGMLYNISSVGDAWVEKHMLTGELFSGETILQIPANTILNTDTDTLEMDQPPALNVKDPEGRRLRQLTKTEGDRTVLAVRVLASNSKTSHDAEEISHSIFGGPNDYVNLKSQVQACSHGKLNFQKRPDLNGIDTNIRNGVVTIKVNMAVNVGHSKIVNAVSQEINRQFGMSHVDIADHVMYCLPNGAYGGVGFALMNRGLSVYNDKLCTSVSTQMHEVGHNLNLGHSSEGTEKYGDQTGVMGYSYRKNEAPKMCYNAAKSFQLGWFRDKSSSYTPGEPGWVDDRTFNLASIVDYDTSNFDVAVELVQPAKQSNFYISFNAGKGFNSGVREAKNQVLVFEKKSIDGSDSSRVADLSSGESFIISDYNGAPGDKLTITARSINLGTSEAVVRVRLERAIAPTPVPTKSPTPSPTLYPTSAPTYNPTNSPTDVPTRVPTNVPTSAPTSSPTSSPTRSPTPKPTRVVETSPPQSPTGGVEGRNPTPDNVTTTTQTSCSEQYHSCTTKDDCCNGMVCQRVIGTYGFMNICQLLRQETKDKAPRSATGAGKRRLRGDSSVSRLQNPEIA
ncbi:unnamed protein product [Cylindrotheca closterium]|uniref:Peptidase M11 gametolysin domain-containing protein n=1 Tax=Cylindrotheca closterium TaxID=2856 RepID=A0AAD2FVA0_9STRA|nr:unnamed protein product [Cylindrotheca closterium]